LEALGIGPGDKILTTPYTFTATAEVVRYLGADPVFADIEPNTLNLDPNSAEEMLRRHRGVLAVIPVHFAGLACDLGALSRLSREYGVPVLEDAAHALPTTWQGQMIGTISAATVFSFYATKPITTGEGGMIVSRDEGLIDRCRIMRLHGINRDVFERYRSTAPSWYYEVVAPGFKYNMPDLAAAIGIHQLRKAHVFQRRRQAIADFYDEAFAGLPLDTPARPAAGDMHAWHLYVIRLRLDELRIDRDRFIELMAERGIGTSVHFIPLHLHPYWRDRYHLTPEMFPIASSVYKRVVSLPIYTRMSDLDVERVAETVRSILSSNLR
jgi:dTDP-4-amino-4,6-dideoxygalactose transaminase